MIYLLLSILANTAIYFVFKWFDNTKIQTFPAIVINYITASTLGYILVSDKSAAWQSAAEFPVWFIGGLCLGVVFISIFYLMALSTQRSGVSITSVASKMSMAVVVLMLVYFDPLELLTWQKIIAILLALTAVVLVSLKKGISLFKSTNLTLPLIVLFGGAIVDFGIAYFSSFARTHVELELFACLPVAVAGVCGIAVLSYQILVKKLKFQSNAIVAGIVLGIINYGSIFFLVKAYQTCDLSSSVVVCINNLMVVIVSASLAVLFLKEKLTKLNLIGLLLAIAAILILMYA